MNRKFKSVVKKILNCFSFIENWFRGLLDSSTQPPSSIYCISMAKTINVIVSIRSFIISKRVLFLQALAPYLPRTEPQLSPAIYELVLNDFLNTDCEVRRNTIIKLFSTSYSFFIRDSVQIFWQVHKYLHYYICVIIWDEMNSIEK